MVPSLSKTILLVMINVLILCKSQKVKSEGRDFQSYLPPDESKIPDYQMYPHNYPFKEDYAECARNPMLPLLGKGLNLLLLKLGLFGIIKAVMALVFVGFLMKLPLLLLKATLLKSFFLPIFIAPLLIHLFASHMQPSNENGSESKPEEAPSEMMTEMKPGMMSGMLSGIMPGMTAGMTAGMTPGMTAGMTSGMTPGMTAGMTSGMTPGMTAGMTSGMTPGMTAGMTPGMTAGMTPGMTAGMTPGMTAGMTPGTMPGVITRKNDMVTEMGRQLNENLTMVAWQSMKMFAESDQCAEKISCMIGASSKDSSMGNIFMRILKYLHYSSPAALQRRVTSIREAFNKGARSSTCSTEDYECQSPELVLQYGVKKLKIL